MPTFVRQTAIPCTVDDLKKGSWVRQAELPSGIQTPRGFVNRASVIGTIVDKQEGRLVLDDGTGTIGLRSFDTTPLSVSAVVGDMVLVVGKPREYDGDRYMLMEICKTVERGWVAYRKKELERSTETVPPPSESTPAETVHVESAEENPFESIMGAIRKHDAGDGADTQEVLDSVTLEEKEKLLNTLIEEGEIFENRPGRVKVLE